MEVALKLAGRNIKVFLRDRTSVFFSFLSVLIIILLYVLFLGDTMVRSLQDYVPDPNVARFFADTWIMAGVLVANAVTTTLGALEVLVNDEDRGINRDFLVAPVKRWQLVAGYILSAWVIGIFIGAFIFVISQGYIVMRGGELISAINALKVLGLIVVNVLAFSSFNFLVVSFFKSNASFSTFSTLVGTMIGFVTGVYVPIGILPNFIQSLILLVPATHGASVMRQLYMARSMELAFAGAPADVVSEFSQIYGITLHLGGKPIEIPVMLIFIFASGVLFFGLSVARLLHKKSA
jgi:multidrug/hemolysin transport system permease protein